MNLWETDAEFMERWENFALDEVVNEPGQQLPEPTRYMAILAALLGCQGTAAFAELLPQALAAGLSAVQLKEIVYQAVDYLGYGRVLPFLQLVNEALAAQGIELPLPGQATSTPQDRLEKGAE